MTLNEARIPSERAVLVTAALGTMLAPLNSTMIVVALPRILDDFNRSLTWGSWIVISYLVAMAAIQPLGGSLGDRYGRQRLFLLGLGVFGIATILAALAWNIEVLILARTLQAVSGAAAIPNGTALVRGLIPAARQGRAFGTIGAGIAVAAALGPPLGGILTDTLGWRWIFAANLLIIIPAMTLGLRLPAGGGSRTGRFDVPGAVFLTVALVSLALSLTVWRLEDVPLAVAPLFGVIAVVFGLALRWQGRRVERPVLNLGLFRRPAYLPATLTVLLSNLTMYTLLLSLPIFLSTRHDWSSSQIGLLLAAMSAQMVVFSPLGGRLSDRYGRRLPAVMGTSLIAAGAAPYLMLSTAWPWYVHAVTLTVVGIGIGLSSAPVQTAAIEAAASEDTGQAAGLFSTMRYLGSITGAGIMAAILTGAAPAVSEFRWLYVLLVAAGCGAALCATRLPSPAKRPSATPATPLPPEQPART